MRLINKVRKKNLLISVKILIFKIVHKKVFRSMKKIEKNLIEEYAI